MVPVRDGQASAKVDRMVRRMTLIAVLLAICLAACVQRGSEITINNRTAVDVVLADGDDGGRYLIPACDGIVIDGSDAVKPLDPSAPLPAGSVLVRGSLPSVPEATVIATLTITSTGIWDGGFPTPPPCEGVPLVRLPGSPKQGNAA